MGSVSCESNVFYLKNAIKVFIMKKLKKEMPFILRLCLMIFLQLFFLCSITACKNQEEYVNGRFCVAIASEYKNVF